MHPIRLALRAAGAAALAALVATAFPSLIARAAGPAARRPRRSTPPRWTAPARPATTSTSSPPADGTSARRFPPGHPSWGSFDELAQPTARRCTRSSKTPRRRPTRPPAATTQKLGTFYRACMDEAAIEKAGTRRSTRCSARRGRLRPPALVDEIAKLQTAGVNDGLDFSSEPDTKDSSKTIASIGLGGLGLAGPRLLSSRTTSAPTRSAPPITTTSPRSCRTWATPRRRRRARPTHRRARDRAREGDADARRAARSRRRPIIRPTSTSCRRWRRTSPWSAFFAQFGAPARRRVDVSVPAFVTGYDAQLAATPLPAWKTYLRFHVADSFANALPKRFADARLRLPQRRAVRRQGAAPALAALHVRRRRVAAHADRQGLRRAGVPARREGARQGDGRQPAVGAARRHRHARLDGTADAAARRREARRVHQEDRLPRRLGRLLHADDPRDEPYGARPDRARVEPRARHGAHRQADGPHAVGHDAADRQRVLQPDEQRDRLPGRHPAAAVLQRDGRRRGELRRDRRGDRPRDDARLRRPGPPVRPARQPRGLVDAGRRDGVRQTRAVHRRRVRRPRVAPGRAHERQARRRARRSPTSAARRSRSRRSSARPQYKAHKTIDGFTPEQRFFLAYAQVWRSIQTEAYTRQLAVVDPHPNDRLRVIGTLSNMPAFQAAFACAATAPMVRKDRCQIW